LGSEVVLPLLAKNAQKYRNPITIGCALLFPIAFALAGYASELSSRLSAVSIALLYVSFPILLGTGLSCYDNLTRCESLLWWGRDGQKRIGVAILGAAAGGGAIVYTLVSGWLVAYGRSVSVCLYALAAFQLVPSLYLVYSIKTGQLDSPPPPPSSPRITAPDDSDADATEADDIESNTRQTRKNDKVDAKGDSKPSEKRRTQRQSGPQEHRHLVTVTFKTRAEALRHLPVVLKLISLACMSFNGYATKVLLSTMFEVVFDLSKLESAYLSALSLVLFLIGRALIPYYLLDSKFKATSIAIVAAFVSAVAYAVLPSIVGVGGSTAPATKVTTRLVGFVIEKSIIGLCFSCLQTLSGSQIYDLVGPNNLQTVLRCGWPVVGLMGTAGPIVAYITAMSSSSTASQTEAFNLFFYLSSGIAVLNTIVNIAMSRMMRNNQSN